MAGEGEAGNAVKSVRTFFTMEGGDSEFAKITLPALKACLKARSQSAMGFKTTTQNTHFSTNSGFSGQPGNDANTFFFFFFILHLPLHSSIIFAKAM